MSPVSPVLQADSLPTEPSGKHTIRREVLNMCMHTGTNTHTRAHTHTLTHTVGTEEREIEFYYQKV